MENLFLAAIALPMDRSFEIPVVFWHRPRRADARLGDPPDKVMKLFGFGSPRKRRKKTTRKPQVDGWSWVFYLPYRSFLGTLFVEPEPFGSLRYLDCQPCLWNITWVITCYNMFNPSNQKTIKDSWCLGQKLRMKIIGYISADCMVLSFTSFSNPFGKDRNSSQSDPSQWFFQEKAEETSWRTCWCYISTIKQK